jgi:hypothetical protein
MATATSLCDGAGNCVSNMPQSCAPYVCSSGGTNCLMSCGSDADCIASDYCNGTGMCAPRVGNGTACTTNDQCVSGNCVDGVCCNTACAGSCQACSTARKGQGSDGVCGAIGAGKDPDNECPASNVVTCGNSGGCNGAGACSTYPVGTVCVAGRCGAANSYIAPSTCTAPGVCSMPTPAIQGCSPYTCGVFGCNTTCASDSDCVTGDFCNSTKHCVAKMNNGAACSAADQCNSGNCVDGFCCNTACTGTCQTCGGSVPGTCANIPAGGTDNNPSCSVWQACDGSGSCKIASGNTCTQDWECVSGICNVPPNTCK